MKGTVHRDLPIDSSLFHNINPVHEFSRTPEANINSVFPVPQQAARLDIDKLHLWCSPSPISLGGELTVDSNVIGYTLLYVTLNLQGVPNMNSMVPAGVWRASLDPGVSGSPGSG